MEPINQHRRAAYLDRINSISSHNIRAHQYYQLLPKLGEIFFEIHDVCNGFSRGCGSYLFNGHDYNYFPEQYSKQELLFEQCQPSLTSTYLEIGVYMGHSLLIALASNPFLKATLIDLDARYAAPAVEVLQRHFPQANLEFIQGDASHVLSTLPPMEYDLVHIDGSHTETAVAAETNLIVNRLTGSRKRIIFDDMDCARNLISQILFLDSRISYTKPASAYRNCYIEICRN